VIDNRVFATDERTCLRCSAEILRDDGSRWHVGHTFSCFLRHHTYVRGGERDGHHEYVCVRCGHPLLFEKASDPYSARDGFTKRVRYLCGLFGHRVHHVTERAGMTEYACHCGHSFMRPSAGARRVRHPLGCVIFAHRVRFIDTRYGRSEFLCGDCGHTFFFEAATVRHPSLARAAPPPRANQRKILRVLRVPRFLVLRRARRR
jgi:DNA-directed RNA polymerase subunit RPC12/RpoP